MSEHQERNDDSSKPIMPQESRFSRRRFIKYGAGASPLLLAIKSPAAWGRGQSFGNGNCSITVLLSANASAPQCTANIKSPGYWHIVLSSSPGSTHYVVKQALEQSTPSIYPGLRFNTFFLNGFSVNYNGWNCYISPASDNPTFIDVLPMPGSGNGNSSGITLLIRCEKAGEQTPPDLDIARFANFHMISVAAYLNSMFAPNIVPYPYYPTQVIAAVQDVVTEIVKNYIDLVESGRRITRSRLNDVINPEKAAFKATYELW